MKVRVTGRVRTPLTSIAYEDRLPTVSVVIPMRNEERSIRACLEAILAQDYPLRLMEILVVDGDSHDSSSQIVESYRKHYPQIRLLRNPAGSIPAGLNIGIRASRGAVVARVDGRTLLAPDYLSTGIRLLRQSGAGNVGGPVRAVNTHFMARVLALVSQSRLAWAEPPADTVDMKVSGWIPSTWESILARFSIPSVCMMRSCFGIRMMS